MLWQCDDMIHVYIYKLMRVCIRYTYLVYSFFIFYIISNCLVVDCYKILHIVHFLGFRRPPPRSLDFSPMIEGVAFETPKSDESKGQINCES